MGCVCKERLAVVGRVHSKVFASVNFMLAPLQPPPNPPHGRMQPLPDHKAVCIDLGAAAAAEQDPRVAHDGAGGELLALEGRGAGQQLVQVLRDVHGAVPVKDVVDDVPRLQRPLQHRNVLLCIQELQDLFPGDREENGPISSGTEGIWVTQKMNSLSPACPAGTASK